jgi:phosphopantothenoylcysteine decarboxylase/phosphopantothenate--cysteine ligase
MSLPTPKHVLLIVTGGIAAYKALEVVRRLSEAGAAVRVVMTPAAQRFVTPLSFQALSGEPVHCDLLDERAEAAMGHIELARWADIVVVAPASADFLARLRGGLADDLASTLCLATTAPLLVAPAMNQQMWQNAATVANLAVLRERGIAVVGPADGAQACGETGPGRLVEPDDIAAAALAHFEPPLLAHTRIIVTAGPTQEAIDPVRYISNRSSGKMGYAVAAAAAAAGSEVTLVSGPTALQPPRFVTVLRVISAAEMFDAVASVIDGADIFISAAAVADYRVDEPATSKRKKRDDALSLTLTPTQDILHSVTARPNPPFAVGFAAETDNLIANARSKLERKSLDMIAANIVGVEGVGFDSNDNELHVLWNGGEARLARAPKVAIARQLIALVADRYHANG